MAPTGAADHDQRLSLAVAGLIAELRSGGQVRIRSCPEKEERNLPAVELVTADDAGELAIEHTRVEAFDEQIEDQHRLTPHAERLSQLLAGRLPAGSRFDLVVDVLATKGRKPSNGQLDRIAAWVEEVAPTLIDGRGNVQGRHMAEAGPPELPFPVTLARWTHDADSPIPALTVGFWKPNDLDDRRIARLERALADKIPKLADAAGEARQAVLVLESNDVQLSNAWDIASALREAARRSDHRLPDWIVLLETETEPALAWVLRRDGSWQDEATRRPLPRKVQNAD